MTLDEPARSRTGDVAVPTTCLEQTSPTDNKGHQTDNAGGTSRRCDQAKDPLTCMFAICVVQLPKLRTRVRFPSPAPFKDQLKGLRRFRLVFETSPAVPLRAGTEA